MAKLERSINGNMNELLNRIESGILNGSMSASLEDASDFEEGVKFSVSMGENLL